MKHSEAKQLKINIAKAASEGQALEEICKAYDCTLAYAKYACRMHNVVFARKIYIADPTRSRAYKIIAALINTNETHVQIANKFHVTRQRIFQIYQLCKQEGIPVKTRGSDGGRDKAQTIYAEKLQAINTGNDDIA